MPAPDDPLDRALHAIADPTRRRILRALKECGATTHKSSAGHTLCAGDVEERIALSQPTISHHMAILTEAGLVVAVKHGQWRRYQRNEAAMRHLIRALRVKL